MTSGVLPYGLVWPKVTKFYERILLFGKTSKPFYIILIPHFRRGV